MKVDWDKFSDGWASGSMMCRRCDKVFRDVRFLYSCHDIVEGNWPRCCGVATKFMDDWMPEGDGSSTYQRCFMSRFRVSFYQDHLYEVSERIKDDEWQGVFKGSLADCEAYVRLKENENIDF